MTDLEELATQRFEAALEATNARDPRAFYRERLIALRETNPNAYREGVDYYRNTLVPAVAREDSDPLALWLDYGCRLAELTHAGETVQIDPTGRRHPYNPPVPPDHMVLHLPESARYPALTVGLPRKRSAAQKAAYELLVERKV